ncbi:AMP-binding protein, partial [Xanthomonas sp. CFBP 8703]
YTSGSTGRPKGVMIAHRGLMNYLQWAAATYHADLGSGSPVHSSISFDATITSLFLPLMAGNRTVLVADGDELADLAA